MAAGSGWTTTLAPYQFEPESEPESEPEKEEGPEQRHESKNVQCEDEFMSSDEEPCDSPAQFSSGEMSDAARQSPKSPGQRTMTKQLIQDDEDDGEEFSTSLSVGDGHYMVDLGSSSEFIVDEESLLQQFRSCRKCSQECKVRKRVEGLKLVLTQVCFFCAHRFTWTNLSGNDDDRDDSDF